MSALKAGGAYFASVFALGFMLGTVRVFLVEPRLGSLGAVLVETPFILAASWFFCGLWIRRFDVGPDARPRMAMGGLAFTLLIAAEIALGLFGFRRSFADILAAYGTAAGAAGLAGQILFGLFPVFRSGMTKRRR